MTIGSTPPAANTDSAYGVGVQKIVQDQQKIEGKAAVDLIEGAGRAVGVHGEGSLVNRYA